MLLNLARRPFVNRKPVRRIGAILLSLGVGLAIVNGYLYWQHWTGQGVAASGLEGVSRELEEERERLQRAFAGFADFDPRDLNGKIEFVNHRILQRTFSWSRLFDDVSDAMPTDVRLLSLAPQFDERRTRRRGRAARMSSREQERSEDVRLEIRGDAKSSEALLAFVDSLFAHEAFRDPDLHQENLTEDGLITFSISTVYLGSKARASASGGGAPSE